MAPPWFLFHLHGGPTYTCRATSALVQSSWQGLAGPEGSIPPQPILPPPPPPLLTPLCCPLPIFFPKHLIPRQNRDRGHRRKLCPQLSKSGPSCPRPQLSVPESLVPCWASVKHRLGSQGIPQVQPDSTCPEGRQDPGLETSRG